MYEMLTKWVEQGTAPVDPTLQSAGGNSGLACSYPKKATYIGNGNPRSASSYTCS
jgi:hypothetical protein